MLSDFLALVAGLPDGTLLAATVFLEAAASDGVGLFCRGFLGVAATPGSGLRTVVAGFVFC